MLPGPHTNLTRRGRSLCVVVLGSTMVGVSRHCWGDGRCCSMSSCRVWPASRPFGWIGWTGYHMMADFDLPHLSLDPTLFPLASQAVHLLQVSRLHAVLAFDMSPLLFVSDLLSGGIFSLSIPLPVRGLHAVDRVVDLGFVCETDPGFHYIVDCSLTPCTKHHAANEAACRPRHRPSAHRPHVVNSSEPNSSLKIIPILFYTTQSLSSTFHHCKQQCKHLSR